MPDTSAQDHQVKNYYVVMKLHQRIIHLIFLTLLIATTNLYGQVEETEADSFFAAYMRSAEAHLEKTQYYDRLQYKYSEDFFQYYLKNPRSKIGKEALKDACVMWINIGETEKLITALDHIAYDSDVWYDILRLINSSNAFQQSKYDEYMAVLYKLEKNLTDPKSRTAALYLLSYDYRQKNNMQEVKNIYREIIKLDADKFYVNQARTYLYELENLSIGQQTPQFEATTIAGEPLSLEKQRNKSVILYFWTTWCGPCIREIPTLQMLRVNYPKDELQIIGISLDEDEKDLNEFLNKRVTDWPQIRQQKSYNDKLSNLYNVQALPRTILIDGDGKIVAKNLRGKRLKEKIAKLLEE